MHGCEGLAYGPESVSNTRGSESAQRVLGGEEGDGGSALGCLSLGLADTKHANVLILLLN